MGKAVELLPPRALEIFVTTEGKNVPHLTIDFILDIKVQSGQETSAAGAMQRLRRYSMGMVGATLVA
ncbi:hypothetical protein ACET3Z_028061 [Daucus carota]